MGTASSEDLASSRLYKHLREMLCDVTESRGEHFFRVTDCRKYVAQKNMSKNVVWGTKVEIFAAATLLKTEICTFTRTAKDRAPC